MASIELKGFKSLFSQADLTELQQTPNSGYQLLAIARLQPGAFQPRMCFSDESLQDLADSIAANGVIQPLVVRAAAGGHYEIVAGERRWRAAQMAGLSEVPVVIRSISNEIALVYALVENLQREDLNVIDKAKGLVRLQQEFTMSHEQIALNLGIARSTVTNFIRILSLPLAIQNWLQTGEITFGHAKLLVPLSSELQLELANKIVRFKLSVRQLEQLLTKDRKPTANFTLADLPLKNAIKHCRETLEKKLSKKVAVHFNQNGKGKLIIAIESPTDLEWLAEHLHVQ